MPDPSDWKRHASDRASFVGRARELDLLRTHLAESLAGRGGTVLIGGEAGIGKTTLAELIGQQAILSGARFLRGHCYDLTETPPYGPWLELVEGLSATDTDLLAFPLAPIEHDAPVGVGSQRLLLDAVWSWVVEITKDRPLVILLDDVHWADPASFDLLRFVARRARTRPLLLVCTYRSDELVKQHPLIALLPALEREASATQIDLGPLTVEDAHSLIAARYALPSPDAERLVNWLRQRTEGNAFFILQLLRALEDVGVVHATPEGYRVGDLASMGLPASLRRVLDARLARLGTGALALLSLAALIGQDVPVDLWATVADVAHDDVWDVIERASDARLIVVDSSGTSIGFTHALIREALYEAVLPTRRRQMHERIAVVLMAATSPDPDMVADQLQRAGDARAATWLIAAGERARRAYAWVTAATRYQAAVISFAQHGSQAEERIWAMLWLARMRSYNLPRRALSSLAAALDEVEDRADAGLVAYARLQRGQLRSLCHERRLGRVEMEAGVETLERLDEMALIRLAERIEVHPQELRASRGSWLLQSAFVGDFAGVFAHASEWAARPVPSPSPGKGITAIAAGWNGMGIALAHAGRPDEALAAFRRAADAYQAADHPLMQANALYNAMRLVIVPFRTTDFELRHRVAEEALACATRARVNFGNVGRWVTAPLDLVAGHWLHAREAMSLSPASLIWEYIGDVYGRLMRDQGQPDKAWTIIQDWLPDGPATTPGDHIFMVALSLQQLAIELALDVDDLALANAWLVAHERWLAWSGATLGQSEGQLLWARYHQHVGDRRAACAHAEAAIERATALPQPLALLRGQRLLGELLLAEGRYEEACTYLNASLALADACSAPFDHALGLIALAEYHEVRGAADRAKVILSEVGRLLEPLAARRALDRVAAIAARLSQQRAPSPRPFAALTAREVEVLRLTAEGLSNAEIASHLFISPRTVSTHLSNIYGKYHFASRSAAIRFALDHGLR